MIFRFKDKFFDCSKRNYLMGILNVTPDSFSDGNKFSELSFAYEYALKMLDDGADIIDIGGESTRPGAPSVSEKEELLRVIPVLEKLKSNNSDIVISIDTTKSEVARVALEAGADIINDISGLQYDEKIANFAAEHNAGLILMHTRGTPETMNSCQNYDDLIIDINDFLLNASEKAIFLGVLKEYIMLDPGIGFAKNAEQNIQILKQLNKITNSFPLLIGHSRKSFIGQILNEDNPEKRVFGTAAVSAWIAMQGNSFLRVHDVKEMKQVLTIIEHFKR